MRRLREFPEGKGLRKAVRDELHIVLRAVDAHFLHDPGGNPVEPGRALLFIPAPAVQQSVFLHIKKHQLQAQAVPEQIAPDPVQLLKGHVGISGQGGFPGSGQLAGLLVDPDQPFFMGDGIDDGDGAEREKTVQLLPQAVKASGLDLQDLFSGADIRHAAADGDLMGALIRRVIIFQDGVDRFFR